MIKLHLLESTAVDFIVRKIKIKKITEFLDEKKMFAAMIQFGEHTLCD